MARSGVIEGFPGTRARQITARVAPLVRKTFPFPLPPLSISLTVYSPFATRIFLTGSIGNCLRTSTLYARPAPLLLVGVPPELQHAGLLGLPSVFATNGCRTGLLCGLNQPFIESGDGLGE